MSISVILASFNGSYTLPRTLAAFSMLKPPSCPVEFLLVDNASDDNTREIMTAFAEHRENTHVMYEDRKGKSFALNNALEKAKGNLIVFTDDDTLPETNWLEAYWDAFNRYPDYSIFAGQIRPAWEGTPHSSISYLANEGKAFGCTFINLLCEAATPNIVKGANFAVRREAIGSLRFDTGGTNFGAIETVSGGCDTTFAIDLFRKGERVLYYPNAIVRHIISKEEMSFRMLIRRSFRIGLGNASAVPIRSGVDWLRVVAELIFSGVMLITCGLTLQVKFVALWTVRVASRTGKIYKSFKLLKG